MEIKKRNFKMENSKQLKNRVFKGTLKSKIKRNSKMGN